MGEPIKIADLARSMIRLSGLSVCDADNTDGDIEIVETGLRPGEKLFEELLIGNNPEPTNHPRIMRAREESWPWEELARELENLDAIILGSGDSVAALHIISRLVPEYAPDSIWSRRIKGDVA